MNALNIDECFGRIVEYWRPKVLAAPNGQALKAVKAKGEFPWHRHAEADELFVVWKGLFRVEFRDRIVAMHPGDSVMVPRGVEHRTCADEEAQVLIFEPLGVLNTGDVVDQAFTAPTDAAL
jgi:mannose-6-phosphate isomerase-like protein (cupin superfamily)